MGRVPAIGNHATPALVLATGTWRSAPLLLASGFRARLQGIRAAPAGWGVVLRTRSVHTIGMAGTVTVIGIGGSGRVRWARSVPPGRVVTDRGAAWIVEMPGGTAGPPPGSTLRAVPMLDRWPGP